MKGAERGAKPCPVGDPQKRKVKATTVHARDAVIPIDLVKDFSPGDQNRNLGTSARLRSTIRAGIAPSTGHD
jgi:hypothetical protein